MSFIQSRFASLALHTGLVVIEGMAWRWTSSITVSLIGRVAAILASTSAFKFYTRGTRLTTHLSSFFR